MKKIKKAKKITKKKSLEVLQKDLNAYVTDKLWNYTDSWKEMEEDTVYDLVWHGTNILWILGQRDSIKLCVAVDEIAEEFRCKFGDKYNLECSCKECKEKNVGKKIDNTKKTADDFEEDFVEYALVRLKGWGGREDFILESLLIHYTHVFWTFDFEDSVLMYLIIDGFMQDFMEEHDGEYSRACACCTEKLERGELVEKNRAC